MVAALVGVFLACGQPGQREQAGRLLDLLVDGLRPRPELPPRDAGPWGTIVE